METQFKEPIIITAPSTLDYITKNLNVNLDTKFKSKSSPEILSPKLNNLIFPVKVTLKNKTFDTYFVGNIEVYIDDLMLYIEKKILDSKDKPVEPAEQEKVLNLIVFLKQESTRISISSNEKLNSKYEDLLRKAIEL